ncbi:MAG TPA: 16S rRNA (cytosine(1402)-N(4))-methyltransferase RsmH [Candidatus Kapabacteria bacterium]|nr:16S rRNA (cytosine(1402)-N(4))-methyltransferase RsmH [Candidatus Kapabacteria bacterium]
MAKHYNKGIKEERTAPQEYDYHLPVMIDTCIEYLINDLNGIYIDGTLGGGGHAAKILQKLSSGGNLLAFDKDPDAIAFAKRKLGDYAQKDSAPKVTFYNECFSSACEKSAVWGKFSGILLDLGVSSKQLDSPSNGISYRFDAPLDMRFGTTGITAGEFINSAGLAELKKVLHEYGEEPFAGLIARRITEYRRASSINTTSELKNLIEEITPPPYKTKTLSRVFQAFRIAVNEELEVLENTLKCIVPRMKVGARIVIMSYHSLEDRIVKNSFRNFAKQDSEQSPKLKILTNKPIEANEQELKLNPRSRSAKLRVAEIL